MANGHCVECGQIVELEETVSRRDVTDPDGTVRVVIVRTMHCERCGHFVRSEEADAEQDQPIER